MTFTLVPREVALEVRAALRTAMSHLSLPEHHNDRRECRQALADLEAVLAKAASEAKVVAYVPVHPRNGPLWMMATDRPNEERLPKSYSLKPLIFAPQQPHDAPADADSEEPLPDVQRAR